MAPTMTWLTWKLVRRVTIVVLLILLAFYLVTFVQVWGAADADDREKTEAIIVLGAAQYNGRPTDVFKARLDHAAALWHAGVAPTIVVTGGKQPGDEFTEAGAGADYLHELDVPDESILRETTGTSSWESLAASARFLQERGIQRVTLVSDPFHSLRIRLIAEELGFDASTSPTRSSPIDGAQEFFRYGTEAVRVAFGEVFGFGRLARASGSAR
jgi:uncharacterized SAM-binding protein YcdF (DUF218 family)